MMKIAIKLSQRSFIEDDIRRFNQLSGDQGVSRDAGRTGRLMVQGY